MYKCWGFLIVLLVLQLLPSSTVRRRCYRSRGRRGGRGRKGASGCDTMVSEIFYKTLTTGAVIGIDTFCKQQFQQYQHSIADCILVIWTPKVYKGACAVCFNPLPEIPPQRAKLYSLMFRVRFLCNELFVQLDYVFEVKVLFVRMPWCGQVVRAHCWADKRVCAACCTRLVPLPCVVC